MTVTRKRHRGYFKFTKSNGKVIVTARHPDAKQAFFGWGSDRDAIDGSFYGTMAARDYYDIDNSLWKWTLTPEGVSRMISNIHNYIDDSNYYSGNEVPVARELLLKLRKTQKRGRTR